MAHVFLASYCTYAAYDDRCTQVVDHSHASWASPNFHAKSAVLDDAWLASLQTDATEELDLDEGEQVVWTETTEEESWSDHTRVWTGTVGGDEATKLVVSRVDF